MIMMGRVETAAEPDATRMPGVRPLLGPMPLRAGWAGPVGTAGIVVAAGRPGGVPSDR